MTIGEKLERILKEHGITNYRIAKDLGIKTDDYIIDKWTGKMLHKEFNYQYVGFRIGKDFKNSTLLFRSILHNRVNYSY